MQKKSVDDLLRFLDYVANKGLMKASTASSRKVAINKVFSVLDEKEKEDVLGLDIDDVIERFHNKKGMDVRPGTLRVYKSRIRSSIEDFERFTENPTSFKPAIRSRNAHQKSSSSIRTRTLNLDDVSSNEGRCGDDDDEVKFSVPVPLREGVIVHITGLPYDLTEEEAHRIARVITAYAPPFSKSS